LKQKTSAPLADGADAAVALGAVIDGDKVAKKKSGSKKAAPEMKVVIAKIQRQKRKYVTAIAGLETVPGLRHQMMI
jgi:hypothetical protein